MYAAASGPIEPNIEHYIQYRALHWDVKYSAEYRPGEPNIELYIQGLNMWQNIDLED